MDFKSLISKIESIDGKIDTPKAPQLPKAVQLNEDAQLRVLSGRTTYVAEAKKKAEEDVKEADDMKVGDKKNIATGTVEKTKTGIVHKSSKAYGGSEEKEAEDEDDKPKKKAKKESVEPEFKSKFMKMVEAKKEETDKKKKMAKKEKMDEAKKPDEDGDGVPDWADKKKGEDDNAGKKTSGKKGMSDKQAKYFGKKVDEAKKKSDDYDYTSGPEFDSRRDEPYDEKSKPTPKGELGKAFRKKMGMPEKKTESKMMPKGKKRPVKESVENKLSFKQMVQLVQESGGQQQIDPVDKALFTWAERVAKNKLGEGMKADLYAGLVYERNGGVFEMYDVLSEDRR
jgi:hypothetical protein